MVVHEPACCHRHLVSYAEESSLGRRQVEQKTIHLEPELSPERELLSRRAASLLLQPGSKVTSALKAQSIATLEEMNVEASSDIMFGRMALKVENL